ncbi:MAG: TraG family conjugative transposon ATPase [Bacteroidota bacterium]
MTPHTPLEHAFPITAISERLLVNKRGDFTMGYRLQLPEVFTLSHTEYEALHGAWKSAFSRLPVDTLIHQQNIYATHQDTAAYAKYRSNHHPNKAYCPSYNQAHYLDRPLLTHESYLFITFPLQPTAITHAQQTLFSTIKNTLHKSPLEDIEALQAQVQQSGDALQASLAAIPGVQVHRLDNAILQTHLARYWNLCFTTPTVSCPIEENNAVASKSPFTIPPIVRDNAGMQLGQYHVRILTLQKEGELLAPCSIPKSNTMDMPGIQLPTVSTLPASMTYPIGMGLPVPHITNTFLEIQDTDKVLDGLQQHHQHLATFAQCGHAGATIRRSALEDFCREVREGQHQVVRVGLNVILYDPMLEVLQQHINATTAAFAQFKGASAWVENQDTANLFFASCPGNGRDHYRDLTSVLDSALCYLTYEGHYLTDTEGTLFVDRFGQPVVVNLWHQPKLIENRNKIIVGPSGTGKSFLINHLVTESLYQGHHVVILDIGGSYKRTCELNKGQYYAPSEATPLAFNIFLCDQDEEGRFKPDADKINFITTVLTTLWRGDKPLAKEGVTLLKEMITHYYAHHGERHITRNGMPNLRDFFAFACTYYADIPNSHQRFFDFDSFTLVLKPFINGQYKDLLNATSNLDLTLERLVVFDLEGIKKDPMIYPIVSIIIIELILEKIKKLKGVRKSFIIDECWDIMRSNLQGFIEYMYRTIRKRQGEVYIATQGAEDIRDAAIGAAMINNTDTFMILDHAKNKAALPVLQQTLGLTDKDIAILSSIDNSHRWNEVFIKMGPLAKVYRLDVSPKTAAVYTSKEEEVKAIEALQAKLGGNLHYAIQQYIENQYAPATREAF